MPTPSGGPVNSGSAAQPVRRRDSAARGPPAPARRCPTARRRSTEWRPAVRSGRRAARRSQRGHSSEMKTAMPERHRRRDEQRQHRRIERAPDERQRAELAGHRIPGAGAPEVPGRTSAIDSDRLPRQLEADGDDDRGEQQREDACARRKPRSRRTHAHGPTATYETLIRLQRGQLAARRRCRAAARSRAPSPSVWPSVSAHCMKSTIALRLVPRRCGVFVEQQPGERRDRIGAGARRVGDRDAEVGRHARRGRRGGAGDRVDRGLDELAGGILHRAEGNLVLQRVDQLDVADRARASATPARRRLRCPCRRRRSASSPRC